jgi:hypothetical protein
MVAVVSAGVIVPSGSGFAGPLHPEKDKAAIKTAASTEILSFFMMYHP